MTIPVLLAAGEAAWETRAMEVLEEAPGRVTLIRRCLDLADLLASVTTADGAVAVVGSHVPGLDAEVVDDLARRGAGLVVVAGQGHGDRGDAARWDRLGVHHLVAATAVDSLVDCIGAARDALHGKQVPNRPADIGSHSPQPALSEPGTRATTLVVWGPAGAPGRTTVAVGLACQISARGRSTLLLDADPFGGTVAQHLGILDQVSGLLAAARSANAGELDGIRLAGAARSIDDRLRVLTGLPRADRWPEVRRAAFATVLDRAVELDEVLVVDTGFCLEDDDDAAYAGTTGRHAMTVDALERADRVIVVGAADPVGVTRLVRGLHDLSERFPGIAPVVVVNRMRPSLGWTERDLAPTIRGASPSADLLFLPDDRPAVDRALMAGRSLAEIGDGPLLKALGSLAEALGVSPTAAGRGRRR